MKAPEVLQIGNCIFLCCMSNGLASIRNRLHFYYGSLDVQNSSLLTTRTLLFSPVVLVYPLVPKCKTSPVCWL